MRIHLARTLSTLTAAVLFAFNAQAATPTFTNITSEDFDKIAKEFSANGAMHSVTAPSALGSIFGFEVGFIGGMTNTPEVDKIVQRSAPGNEAKYFPHAGLLGAVTVPMGFTGEAVFFPRAQASGVDYQQYALGLKWNANEVIPVLPVNVAIRGFYSNTSFNYNQTYNDAVLGNITTDVKAETKVMGAQILVSPQLIPILEPYAGLGFVKSTATMNSSAGSLFASGAQSMESTPSSMQVLFGLDVRLLLIGFGVEYAQAFDTASVTGKFSLKF